jgi:hypothetical protein
LCSSCGVVRRDDPAHHHRHVVDARRAQPVDHRRDDLQVRAREDRQPDDVHAFLHGGGDDLRGREPDALVDHLEADVAGAHGHLLGPVAVPVEARLADEHAEPLVQLLAGRTDPRPHRRDLPTTASPETAAADPGRGAELAEHLAQHAGPLPVVTPASAQRMRGLHEVRVGLGRVRSASRARLDGGASAPARQARIASTAPASVPGRRSRSRRRPRPAAGWARWSRTG